MPDLVPRCCEALNLALKISTSAGWENCVAWDMAQTFPIMLVLLLLKLKLSQSRVFLFSKIYIMVKMWYKIRKKKNFEI